MKNGAAKGVSDAPGSVLRRARETLGIGVGDIAASLRLEEDIVVAIEEGRNDELPADAYVRGYVRAYARLVGVDAEALAKRIEVVSGSRQRVALLNPLKPSFADRLQRHLGLLIGGIVVVTMIAAAVVLWLVGRSYDWSFEWPFAPAEESEPVVLPPVGEPPRPTRGTTSLRSPAAEDVTADLIVDEGDAAASVTTLSGVAEGEQPAAPATDVDTLTFRFSEDSWVEVREASDETIYADLGRAGQEVFVSGEAPFGVLIGYAAGVELVFNDDPVALRPHTRENVARLVVGQ